jgi:hypothetical protein
MTRRLFANVDWRVLAGLVGLMVPIGLLWSTSLLYPLKILVVFFHEISHGLVAVATGGSIDRIEVVAAEGGLCVTRGGSRFLTLSAGYLGSLVWGGVLLVLASRTRLDRVLAAVLGGILVLVAIAFVRPIASFGFVFGLLSGLALVASGIFLPEVVNDTLLRIFGLTSCFYALLDIKSDILDRPQVRSDAVMLAEVTKIPGVVWGVIWIAVALLASFVFLCVACKKKSRVES